MKVLLSIPFSALLPDGMAHCDMDRQKTERNVYLHGIRNQIDQGYGGRASF